jgi:hypothetical protein
MLWLKENFGGHFRKVVRRRVDWRESYVWETHCAGAAHILRIALPYFVIKREQAELAISYQATKTHSNARGVRPAMDAEREEAITKIRILNGGKNALVA